MHFWFSINRFNTQDGYLFQVVVDCPSSGHQQVFLCQKWLADDEGDQLIERDLYESEDMRLKRRPSMIIVIFKERFCFSINSNTCLLLLIFEYVHVQDNFFGQGRGRLLLEGKSP